MATARSVMVVTAASEFGDLIQTMLEETGLYKVMVVDSDQEALLCIQTVAFTIAILDADLPGGSTISLATIMRQKLPKMRLVIICAEENPLYPAVVTFRPEGLLSKPFYLPDLLDTLTKAFQAQKGSGNQSGARATSTQKAVSIPSAPPPPEWLHDASWAARNLTQLSLETSAQAAMIVHNGSLWAYAGELSEPAAMELVETINSCWDAASSPPGHVSSTGRQQEDMVRFIHLESTQGEYMLYATSLGKGMALSLVFDAETPFSLIRAQANYLARALASPPGSPLPPSPKAAVTLSTPTSVTAVTKSISPSSHLPPLLEDVPPPSPHLEGKTLLSNDQSPSWFDEASLPAAISETPARVQAQSSPAQINQFPTSAPPASPAEPNSIPQNLVAHHDELSISTSDLLPASPTLHYLICSCTLLPRLPQHQLAGDLTQLLREWVPVLILSFGWQLLRIHVLPEYLLVIARIAPNTSPGAFVRILRQQTSRRIFSSFPQFASEIPSRDFWAPGYLLLSSSQSPPTHIIRHFIAQTRYQQGFSKNG